MPDKSLGSRPELIDGQHQLLKHSGHDAADEEAPVERIKPGAASEPVQERIPPVVADAISPEKK